jgi:hypothetical protein
MLDYGIYYEFMVMNNSTILDQKIINLSQVIKEVNYAMIISTKPQKSSHITVVDHQKEEEYNIIFVEGLNCI